MLHVRLAEPHCQQRPHERPDAGATDVVDGQADLVERPHGADVDESAGSTPAEREAHPAYGRWSSDLDV